MIKGLYKFAEKWSEKGSVWIVSDTHFDDPDRELMCYTFSSEEHAEIIRKMVTKSDTLIHLGDVGNPEYFSLIRGYKVLVMGNHDQSAQRFEPYFDEIYTGPLMISERILLSHESIDGLDWCVNLHGHDHSLYARGDQYHINFAANVVGYKPVSLGVLIKKGILSKIDSIHRHTINDAIDRKKLMQKMFTEDNSISNKTSISSEVGK